jgi:hypothetical protein
LQGSNPSFLGAPGAPGGQAGFASQQNTPTLDTKFGMKSSTQVYGESDDELPEGSILQSDETGKRDGRWVTLQDWSSCTLACGGGSQTLQRFCIPPLNGGAACEGEALDTKECNSQPCPSMTIEHDLPDQVVPPEIKMIPISNRPQRFEECVIKESDLDVIKEEMTQFARKPRIPSRVIMNNSTLSVFESDNYESVLVAFNLDEIVFPIQDHPDDPAGCFVVADNHQKRVSLCAMGAADKTLTEIKNEWIADIGKFKNECRMSQEPVLEDPDVKKQMAAMERDVL